MVLFTVLIHELTHHLGAGDEHSEEGDSDGHFHSVMAATITPGRRRLVHPDENDDLFALGTVFDDLLR